MNINPMDLLKNLQQMQGKMGEAQSKLKELRVEGTSGGDLVKVVMNGEMEVLDLTIDPVAVDPRDVPMLEELIVSAISGASKKMKEKIQQEMAGMAGMEGLGDLMSGFTGGGE